jgi:alpha-galactosidase
MQQKKVYVAYIEDFYGILSKLRAKHPKVAIESCSGGGGASTLAFWLTDDVWPRTILTPSTDCEFRMDSPTLIRQE